MSTVILAKFDESRIRQIDDDLRVRKTKRYRNLNKGELDFVLTKSTFTKKPTEIMTTPNQKMSETPYTSPCKVGGGGEYFEEGMRVMFFNIANVDLPAFAVGKLDNRLDPNVPTFNVVWEQPSLDPWDQHEEDFDNEPLILHPDRIQNEIQVREIVHEARLLMYGARIRHAVSIDQRSVGTIVPDSIKELHLEKYDLGSQILNIRERINKYNRETCAIIQQPVSPKRDRMEIPADLYRVAESRINEHMKQVNQLEASMGIIPSLRGLIPEKYRVENIDPLLLWIHQQSEKEEAPTEGVARMPAATTEAKTPERIGLRKGIPDMINVPNPAQGTSNAKDEKLGDTKPAATKRQTNLGIMNTLPQCQNIEDVAENICDSEFGKLKLKQFYPNEPSSIGQLNDLEVIIAYSTFLLMIVGRMTTSNIIMDAPHDWYATNMKYRTTFINGFYGAWYNIEKTWDNECATKYRSEETENGLVAALGSLRACTIGANDEYFLHALNNGGKIDKKMYYKIVGHPKVKKVEDDAAKIIHAPHEFEEAPNDGGRLYDSILNFLPNKNKLEELRVPTRRVTVDARDIKTETKKKGSIGSKRGYSAMSVSVSPSKRHVYAGRNYSDSDESYETNHQDSETDEEDEGGDMKPSGN